MSEMHFPLLERKKSSQVQQNESTRTRSFIMLKNIWVIDKRDQKENFMISFMIEFLRFNKPKTGVFSGRRVAYILIVREDRAI